MNVTQHGVFLSSIGQVPSVDASILTAPYFYKTYVEFGLPVVIKNAFAARWRDPNV